MNKVTDFLNEVMKCVVGLDTYRYNGLTVQQSSNAYQIKLIQLYNDAINALIENVNFEENNALHKKINDVVEAQALFDIPTEEDLQSIYHDFFLYNTPSLKKDYEFYKFIFDCAQLQRYYFQKFMDCFNSQKQKEEILPKHFAVSPTVNTDDRDNARNQNIIEGIEGLMNELSIGKTKATQLSTSKLFRENGIRFKVGKSVRFYKDKLEKLIKSNPNILQGELEKNI